MEDTADPVKGEVTWRTGLDVPSRPQRLTRNKRGEKSVLLPNSLRGIKCKGWVLSHLTKGGSALQPDF